MLEPLINKDRIMVYAHEKKKNGMSKKSMCTKMVEKKWVILTWLGE